MSGEGPNLTGVPGLPFDVHDLADNLPNTGRLVQFRWVGPVPRLRVHVGHISFKVVADVD